MSIVEGQYGIKTICTAFNGVHSSHLWGKAYVVGDVGLESGGWNVVGGRKRRENGQEEVTKLQSMYPLES